MNYLLLRRKSQLAISALSVVNRITQCVHTSKNQGFCVGIYKIPYAVKQKITISGISYL